MSVYSTSNSIRNVLPLLLLPLLFSTTKYNCLPVASASPSPSSPSTSSTTSIQVKYNTQQMSSWPGTGQWLALTRSLSTYGELYGPFQPSDYDDQCGPDEIDTTNPFTVAQAGEGICMQYPSCANQFCLQEKGDMRDDLPAYALMAMTEQDVMEGVRFANIHNIQVTVKSSGHSWSGASTGKDSLLIWLAKYPEDASITKGYVDSCGDNSTAHDVVGVSAGMNFASIARAVGDDYHFVSASEASVSASGGWVQGGGLSYTSRMYGLGVDNVVDFRVVLPSGAVAVVDRCTNKNLFWALRGGGGGTFGVVTHMHYKIHKPTPIVRFQFDLGPFSGNTTAVAAFMKYWVENSPHLDARWGGRFSASGLDLFFAGALPGAKATFIDDFALWIQEIELFANGSVPKLDDVPYSIVYSSWSKVLPDLEEATGEEYITEATFSRLIPYKTATRDTIQTYQLLESLALSKNLGYTNYLLGKKINEINDQEMSVNPAMRESAFLVTGNQYAHEKMVQMLPNNVTGVSKNYHGGLEPEWRQSIWGEHYERLLGIKKLIDPTNVMNCYQSVGYVGDEADIYNVERVVNPPPAPTPSGQLGVLSSSASSMIMFGGKIGSILFAVGACIANLW